MVRRAKREQSRCGTTQDSRYHFDSLELWCRQQRPMYYLQLGLRHLNRG